MEKREARPYNLFEMMGVFQGMKYHVHPLNDPLNQELNTELLSMFVNMKKNMFLEMKRRVKYLPKRENYQAILESQLEMRA